MSPSMVHRHRDVQGGSARAAVFGVSDGLVSNVALILGFAGASTDPSLIRLAGITGLLAGAISMASGEYVSLKAQAELVERELEIERESVTCRVNGEERQTSGVDDLIFKLPQVVKFISEVMTLMPGDIILTGTPSGVGELLDGDEVEVEVTGVGVLRHTVSGVLK